MIFTIKQTKEPEMRVLFRLFNLLLTKIRVYFKDKGRALRSSLFGITLL